MEFPTPERLLPIGQHGKDEISSLVEKVREALAVPDMSHLRQDSLDKSEVCRLQTVVNGYYFYDSFCLYN